MKRAICLTVRHLEHQVQWAGAFRDGLRRHGWQIYMTDNQHYAGGGDLYISWSTRHVHFNAQAKRARAEIIILERGYMDDRYEWTSISFGGQLNGRATFRGPFEDGSRFEKLFAHHMKPWRQKPKGYALILGQLSGDMAMKNVNPVAFYQRAKNSFSAIRVPTKFRAHPHLLPKHGKKALQQGEQSLLDDLAGACCAVTWNSSAGVKAVLAGVPTVAMDEGSMAYEVTGHELAIPPTPDRTKWAHALAWKQWLIDEVASGYCWDNIKGDL